MYWLVQLGCVRVAVGGYGRWSAEFELAWLTTKVWKRSV